MSYVDQIVEEFGGVRPMARALSKAPSTVKSWKDRGSIPDDQKEIVWACALEQGINLLPIHFVPTSIHSGAHGSQNKEDAA